jgi:hypothetical protein
MFMVSQPLLGWRTVFVTERRTAVDFAEVVRWLVEELHPEAEKVVLVTRTTTAVIEPDAAVGPGRTRRCGEEACLVVRIGAAPP